VSQQIINSSCNDAGSLFFGYPKMPVDMAGRAIEVSLFSSASLNAFFTAS